MIQSIEKYLFYWYMRNLYRKECNLYFPTFSQAPKYLNFAYPDFSIEYYVTSLCPNKEIRINGTIPMSKVVFYSITLYYADGLPYFSKSDIDLGHNSTNSNNIIPYEFTVAIKKPSAMIVRFYRKNPNSNESFVKYLPKFSVEKKTVTDRKKRSLQLQHDLEKRILQRNKKLVKTMEFDSQFFKPAKENLQSLFPNAFAQYLIAKPEISLGYIEIKTPDFSLNGFRFIGFMASNYMTTETDDSFSCTKPNTKYKIWFCHRGQHDIKLTSPNEHIIQWKNNNKYPLLVYREVSIKGSMLSNYSQSLKKPQLISIMNYPDIHYDTR